MMDGLRTPTRRPLEDMDVAAPISMARQFLADRDVPSNQGDAKVCTILRQLLRYHDAIAEQAGAPQVRYDRQLVATMLRMPQLYDESERAMQAALVAGTLGPDTKRTEPRLAGSRKFRRDED